MLLSGAFLLALALLGAVLAAAGGAGPDPARTQPPAAVSVVPGASRARAGSCALPAGSQAVPSASPPVTRWETVGAMQAPQNRAMFGPERSSGPWNTCFAHNPSGALLAAMNLWAEGTAVPPRKLFARLAVGAPASLGNSAQLDAAGPVQFAGYRFDSYVPSEAQLHIVLRGPEGKLVAVATAMVWRNGDWKYLFPPGGAPAMQVIGDLSGYVPWSGF